MSRCVGYITSITVTKMVSDFLPLRPMSLAQTFGRGRKFEKLMSPRDA